MVRSFIRQLFLFPISNPKKWALIRSAVTALPAIVLAFTKYDFSSNEPGFHKTTVEFFKASPAAVLLLMAATIPISLTFDVAEYFAQYLRDKRTDTSPRLHLSRTLVALTNIVGYKLTRLGTVMRTMRTDRKCPPSIAGIIDPDEQIQEIIKQAQILLTALCETDRLKLVLVDTACSPKRCFAAIAPQTDQPPQEILNNPETFVTHVQESRSFQCISDIEKHLSKLESMTSAERKKKPIVRYLKVDGGENSGSICGFPVLDAELNTVVYVLTIMHPDPNRLTKKFKVEFGPILNHFFSRLLLERRLKILLDHDNKSPT